MNNSIRSSAEVTDVYNKFVDTVYRVCFMMLKNESETEDATQNVFIKYMNYEKKFASDEHVKAWLIVTAKNECKNMLKHWFHSKRTPIDEVKEGSYEDKNQNEVLEQVMKLDKKYRVPLYLYYYEGYSTLEISDMLGIKHSTVRTHMAKGREKLKLLLEEDGYED